MKKEYIYALISILLWSTTATITKLLLGSINSMQILLISSLFATIFLFIINLIKGNLKELKKYKIKDYLKISGIGVLGTFLYNIFLYLGINTLQASQAFVINYLWPIMIMIFACIILKEKLTKKKIIAIFLSFVGIIFVTSNGQNIFLIEQNTYLGVIYCILAAVSYGLFSVLNKKEHYNKFVSMMLFYFISFLLSLLYNTFMGSIFVPNTYQTFGLVWIGVFTSAIAFTSWSLALDYGETSKISNLAYITPFLSLIWTNLILKEPFSICTFAGLLFIIMGISIQLLDKKGKTRIKKNLEA